MARAAVSSRPRLAKFSPPKLKQPVMRERLFAKLDEGAPAVWLYGPPGSGKTTLAASYLQSRGRKTLWFQVDSDDSEPSTFFHFLAEANLGIGSARVKLPEAGVDARTDWISFARRFARALDAALPTNAALVFDNVHEGGETLGGMMAVIVAEMMDPHRLLLISHHAPPALYGDAIAKQKLSIVTPDSLSFNLAETGEFAKAMKLGKKSGAEHMLSVTNGLAAGIVLLATQGGGEKTLDTQSELPSRLTDYISHSIVDWLPERTRHVVTSCAFFPDFDAAMAGEASGDPSAGELIADLHRLGFFVEQRGGGANKRYALHSLLVEALRNRVGRPGSEARRLAEQQAGMLLLRAGGVEAGIGLLLSARAYAEAAGHIEAVAKRMVDSGREEQLANWIGVLPKEWLEKFPWLEYWHAVATVSFDFQAAQIVFENVCRRFRENGDALGLVLAAAAVLVEFEMNWLHAGKASPWADILTGAWRPELKFPDTESEIKAVIGLLATYDVEEKIPRAVLDQHLARLSILIPAAKGANLKLLAGAQMLNILNYLREFEQGLLVINLIKQQVDLKQVNPRHMLHWLICVDQLLTTGGRVMFRPDLSAEAVRYRADARAVAVEEGAVSMLIVLAQSEANAACNARDADAAESALDKVEALLMPSMYMHLSWQYSARCLVSLVREQYTDALKFIEKAFEFAAQIDADDDHVSTIHHLAAACLIALGRHDEADARIAIAIGRMPPGHSRVHELARLLNHAVKEMNSQGKKDNALRIFFAQMRAWQMLDFAVTFQPILVALCAEALRRKVDVESIKDLIRRRKLPAPEAPPADWPWPIRLEAMGGFRIFIWDKPLTFGGKSQKKPIEMLKYLVARNDSAQRNKGVRVDDVILDLWPSVDTKDPKSAFDVNVHRMRHMLAVDNAVIVTDGRISLNREMVWCDAFEFDAFAGRSIQGDAFDVSGAIANYGGPLFGREEDTPWMFAPRERLAARFSLLVQQQGAILESAGAYTEAVAIYERGLGQDNLVEPFYQGLMRCHLALEQPAEAMRAYRRCKEILSIVVGLKPAPETELLRKRVTLTQ